VRGRGPMGAAAWSRARLAVLVLDVAGAVNDNVNVNVDDSVDEAWGAKGPGASGCLPEAGREWHRRKA
jgi:hypothetical protein